MPVVTRTITRQLQQPGVPVFTPSTVIPSGLNFVKIEMDIDPALIQDPTVECAITIERSTQAAPTTWRLLAAASLTGNPLNALTAPYVVVPGVNLASIVGQNVRGKLVASIPMQLGAIVTVDFT